MPLQLLIHRATTNDNATDPTAASNAYRTCARRLRHVHRDDSVRRMRALQSLSSAYDRAQGIEPGRPAAVQPAAEEHFARLVAENLEGGVLRYSRRLALIRHAMALRIGRFEANLIIATVEHRAQNGDSRPARPARSWFAVVVAACVVIEAIVFVGAWWAIG